MDRENDDYDDEDDGNGEWEDVDSNEDETVMRDVVPDVSEAAQVQTSKPQTKKKEIWDETKEPLKEGEELVFDNSAY